jgi:hypothetical protein
VTTMQRSHAVPDYEPLRAWAVSPVSSPPPGWGHVLRGGMAAWVRQTPAMPPDAPSSSARTGLDVAPLARLVAAMIAQVCS